MFSLLLHKFRFIGQLPYIKIILWNSKKVNNGSNPIKSSEIWLTTPEPRKKHTKKQPSPVKTEKAVFGFPAYISVLEKRFFNWSWQKVNRPWQPRTVCPRGLPAGADNVTWTHTVLLPLEPESSASADSAISANHIRWASFLPQLTIRLKYYIKLILICQENELC